MTPIFKSVLENCDPRSDDEAWRWVADNVDLPPDSELKKFDFELFPLARFVLETLCHDRQVRRFTEMLSAQVGKTVTILAYLCWKIVNRPSSVGWYTDTSLNAKGDFKTKIEPTLMDCPKVRPLMPIARSKKENTLIQFGFMNLRVMGAESKRNREGKTMSEVLCDEVRNYPPGAIDQIDNRFKTISNYRRILFSSAGDISQEPWISYKKGTRHQGFWKCVKCQHSQTFRFGKQDSPLYPNKRDKGGFVWEDNAETHPADDVYDFQKLVPTIRYECEGCGYRYEESEKIALIRQVVFIRTNPMADPTNVSVHCWEAYMPFAGCSWGNIVMKFLNASVAMRTGQIEPMKTFVKESLGEPWEDRGEKPMDGEILKRCGEYSIGEEWPTDQKFFRQMSVDMQHGFVKYNYSIFKTTGEKRTVQTGVLATLDEVRAFQIAHNIKDSGVGIDCAYHPAEVLEQCLKYGRFINDPRDPRKLLWIGWRPLLGDDAEEFTDFVVDNNGNKHAVKSTWKAVLINANEGRTGAQQKIHRYSWSGPHYKTLLYFRRIKGIGPRWEIPQNVGTDYIKQLSCTERVDKRDAEGTLIGYEWRERGRHDDADTELMQLVLSDINGITV